MQLAHSNPSRVSIQKHKDESMSTHHHLAAMHAESGMSLRRIQRETGAVSASRLCRFLAGKVSLREEQIDAVQRLLRRALIDRARRIEVLLGRAS
jgi:hypothetical protein